MKPSYRQLAERADRIASMRRERARQTCKAAGLDPNLLGIHPHNAMVSYNAGRPWKGVDYSLVRKTIRVIEQSYEPRRVLERLYHRKGYDAFTWD